MCLVEANLHRGDSGITEKMARRGKGDLGRQEQEDASK